MAILIRVQKLIARYGFASRREAEKLIADGRVRVNGVVIYEQGIRVDESSVIEIDGRVINREIRKTYLILHKPEKSLCARRDPFGRTLIYDLLDRKYRDVGLFSVGRLDYMSEGLILLTNDGEFAHRIMHPSGGLIKKYEVISDKEIPYKRIAAWKNGVYIRREKYTVTDIIPVSKKKVLISLTEGKNREIRRLFEHVDIPVKKLRRIAIGTLKLEDIPKGTHRELTEYEVKRLLEEVKT